MHQSHDLYNRRAPHSVPPIVTEIMHLWKKKNHERGPGESLPRGCVHSYLCLAVARQADLLFFAGRVLFGLRFWRRNEGSGTGTRAAAKLLLLLLRGFG